MTDKTIAANHIDWGALQDRRNALVNERFNILFYGGWFMYDQHKTVSPTTSFTTMEQALDAAELANTNQE